MLEAKGQLARIRRILNPGCAAYFNKDEVSGRFRCPPGGWLAGLGRFVCRTMSYQTEARKTGNGAGRGGSALDCLTMSYRVGTACALPPSVAPRPQVAACSPRSGAAATEAPDKTRRKAGHRFRHAFWRTRFPSAERPPTVPGFPPPDPVREAGARADNAAFAPACSSPPFVAMRPRVAGVRL